MPALVAKLIPIALFFLLGYWLVKELESLDRRREEIKDHPVWSKLWPLMGWLVDFWMKIKRNRTFVLWVLRGLLFIAAVIWLIRWMAG
ncbi:hypothetical protein C4561_02060 [candidate division WWE3 bacterium]|jgi:hypothetical protein|uniref:Uncharacterized protein n=1 Tax=candidate division WWE3 bacterium TaxID=2053526 RepID=A0A3A4ZKP9_UNCKA|nr:MAG: hypothetical protein C4561_02060 [candidate division WWE3 bacterium]